MKSTSYFDHEAIVLLPLSLCILINARSDQILKFEALKFQTVAKNTANKLSHLTTVTSVEHRSVCNFSAGPSISDLAAKLNGNQTLVTLRVT